MNNNKTIPFRKGTLRFWRENMNQQEILLTKGTLLFDDFFIYFQIENQGQTFVHGKQNEYCKFENWFKKYFGPCGKLYKNGELIYEDWS